MEPGEWQELLGCEAGSVIDEIESHVSGRRPDAEAVPGSLLEIFMDDQLELAYFDAEDGYDNPEYAEAVFSIGGREVSHGVSHGNR